MKIIGLCGGSGSGKGTVAAMLAEYGALHIDTDAVYHGLTSGSSACLDELVSEFGEGILAEDGSLDRRALSKIVFADGGGEALGRLNSISHRHVLAEVRRIIAASEGKYTDVLVDAPLLYESGFDAECDFVVAVIAPKEERIRRIMARDGVSEEAAARRIAAQTDDATLASRADFVINNGGDLASLEAAAKCLADRIGIGE